MGELFLSPFECSEHCEWCHHFDVLIEPLMNGIGTAHRQSHRIPPSPNPSSRWDTRAAGFISLNKKPLVFLLSVRDGSILNDLRLSLQQAGAHSCLCPHSQENRRFRSSCLAAALRRRGLNLPTQEWKIFSFLEICLKCLLCVFLA